MVIEKQLGMLLELIFDVANRPEAAFYKQQRILQMIEHNDKYEAPFLEFMSWFKVVEVENDTVQPEENPKRISNGEV
jgi:hypothetical protein